MVNAGNWETLLALAVRWCIVKLANSVGVESCFSLSETEMFAKARPITYYNITHTSVRITTVVGNHWVTVRTIEYWKYELAPHDWGAFEHRQLWERIPSCSVTPAHHAGSTGSTLSNLGTAGAWFRMLSASAVVIWASCVLPRCRPYALTVGLTENAGLGSDGRSKIVQLSYRWKKALSHFILHFSYGVWKFWQLIICYCHFKPAFFVFRTCNNCLWCVASKCFMGPDHHKSDVWNFCKSNEKALTYWTYPSTAVVSYCHDEKVFGTFCLCTPWADRGGGQEHEAESFLAFERQKVANCSLSLYLSKPQVNIRYLYMYTYIHSFIE